MIISIIIIIITIIIITIIIIITRLDMQSEGFMTAGNAADA